MAYDLGEEAIDPYFFKEYKDNDSGELKGFEIGPYGVELMYRKPGLFLKDVDLWEFIAHLVKEM